MPSAEIGPRGDWMRSHYKHIVIGTLISLVLAFGILLARALTISTGRTAQASVSHKSGTPLTSPSQKPTPPPPAAVPPPGTVANTASKALKLAMPYFFGIGSSWGVHQVSSIVYVKTTTNDALAVLGPRAQGAENSTVPAWLLIAKGVFQSARGDVCQCTPPIYNDLAIVVVEGQPGFISAKSNHPYNLSGLGTEVSVPPSRWSQKGATG